VDLRESTASCNQYPLLTSFEHSESPKTKWSSKKPKFYPKPLRSAESNWSHKVNSS
jgi:hypothetical protein